MKHVVILAGGKGSRLHKYTGNLYSKIMISIGQETILDGLIRFYSQYEDLENFDIIVSELGHIKLIETYIEKYHSEFYKRVKVSLLYYSKLDGTFNTINNMYKDSNIKDVVFNWCDVIPSNKFEIPKDARLHILLDKEKRHRISLNNNKIINHGDDLIGNIVGVFYVKDFNNIFKFSVKWKLEENTKDQTEVDLTDAIKEILYLESINDPHISVITSSEQNFTDIGDLSKYNNYLDSINIDNRFMNSIRFDNDTVTKMACNDQANSIISSEINWYKEISETEKRSLIPEFKNDFDVDGMKGYKLSRIKGVTLNTALTNGDISLNESIDLFHNIIHKLHGGRLTENSFHHHHKEYFTVTKDRLFDINFMIEMNEVSNLKLNNNITHYYTDDVYSLLSKAMLYLNSEYRINGGIQWGLIHGDTNTTNLMIEDHTGDLYMIDPRGKFGDSELYGDVYYDYAKFIYGLHGYSNFNIDKKFEIGYNPDDKSLSFDYSKYGFDLDDIITKFVKGRKINSRILKVLVGIIHLKLVQYIRNNPSKMYATYYYGRYILESVLNK